MKRSAIAASVLSGLALGGPVALATAQTRVVVPVIVQSPRAAATSRASSIQVTTQSTAPARGSTATRVTVQDTTGRLLGAAPLPRAGTPASGVTTTRVTVQDTTGRLLGVAPAGARPPVPGATTTRVTVQDTTGRLLGVAPTPRPVAPATGSSSVVLDLDRGPAPIGVGPGGAAGIAGGRQTWTITSDGPIEVPIIILTD